MTTWTPHPDRTEPWTPDHRPDDALPEWARPADGVHVGLRRLAQVGLALAAALAAAAVLWPPTLPAAALATPVVDPFDGRGLEVPPDPWVGVVAYLASWAGAALLARLVVTLLVGAWLARVAAGPRVERAELRRAPGWAVGAWLLPVVSLWWPMQVVRDLWWAAVPADRRPDLGVPGARPTPVVVGAWWGAWVLADVVGLAARWLVRHAQDAADVEQWMAVDRVATGLWAPAALLLLVVLHRLGRRVGSLGPR